MSKKIFSLLLVLVFIMTLFVSCNNQSGLLKEYGEDVISLMVEMLNSEEYQALYSIPSSYDDEFDMLQKGDYSKSIAVYELSIPKEVLLDSNIDKNGLSDKLYEYICSSAYTSFAARINQLSGIDSMSISTIFAAQKIYAYKGVDTNTIYLYVFENGCPIAVTFVASENTALRAVGYFIINEKFITDNEESIKESCTALGMKDVTVTKQ